MAGVTDGGTRGQLARWPVRAGGLGNGEWWCRVCGLCRADIGAGGGAKPAAGGAVLAGQRGADRLGRAGGWLRRWVPGDALSARYYPAGGGVRGGGDDGADRSGRVAIAIRRPFPNGRPVAAVAGAGVDGAQYAPLPAIGKDRRLARAGRAVRRAE